MPQPRPDPRRPIVVLAAVLLTALAVPSSAAGVGRDASAPETRAPGAPASAATNGDAGGVRGMGTEQREWVDGLEKPRTSPKRYPVRFQENVMIPMRDGVLLEADLHLPDVPGRPFPCVLRFNPYGNTAPTTPEDIATRGYAFATVSGRGSGGSGGVAGLYDYYDEDGYDVVEWMAGQPWCDGNVGMIGASRLGIPQWRTARALPPSLKAIVPTVACGDCYWDHWFRGGTMAGPGRQRQTDVWEVAEPHRNFDAFWRERSTRQTDHEQIAEGGVAAMVVGGWEDYITAANIRAYEDFAGVGGEGRLVVGPWAHSTGAGLEPYTIQELTAQWFDHHLRGINNRVDRDPAVLIYVQGANQWRMEEAWPIPDARTGRLYLREQRSNTIDSRNDGSLRGGAARSDEDSVAYTYDPQTGPFMATGVDQGQGRVTFDQRPDERNVLTWTSRPFSDHTEVTGEMNLVLWAATQAADFDFIVQVTDVAPDGTSTQVTTGALNAQRFFDRSNPVPLTPGEVNRYEVLIEPTSYVFQKGHRLRIDVGGGSKIAPGQTSPQNPGPSPIPAEVSIYQDARHRSYVDVPLIGSATLPD